jgi:hypothetical protein
MNLSNGAKGNALSSADRPDVSLKVRRDQANRVARMQGRPAFLARGFRSLRFFLLHSCP